MTPARSKRYRIVVAKPTRTRFPPFHEAAYAWNGPPCHLEKTEFYPWGEEDDGYFLTFDRIEDAEDTYLRLQELGVFSGYAIVGINVFIA